MSLYVLMKILESAPSRYDLGIRLLTLGEIDKVYDRLTAPIQRGQHVLDIGCGTGALTLRALAKGATVKGIDVNPQMLEIAQKRVLKPELLPYVELDEMGVAELGSEKADHYDVVMSGLCFSELTDDELRYTLKEVKRMLKPGGLLLVADEASPEDRLKKFLHRVKKFPLALITYIFTQTTTHAIKNLPEKIKETGFLIKLLRLNKTESFIELIAKKPE